jgi:hypothetical protein
MTAQRIYPPDDLFEIDTPKEEPSGTRLRTASLTIEEWVRPKLERLAKPKPFRSSPSQIRKARSEMDLMAASGQWDQARGHHLVALYEWLHREVYGVEAAELDGRTWAIAASMAGRQVANEFGGRPEAAVDFLQWVWKREQGREQYRRDTHREGGRIGWRIQFGRQLLTDYRVSLARMSG